MSYLFNKKALGFIIIFWLTSTLVFSQSEPTRKMDVEGRIDFSGLSRSVASRRALDQALKNAVKEVAMGILSGATPTGSSVDVEKMVTERILNEATLYIANYQVIEEHIETNFWVTKISAEIWLKPVTQALKDLKLLTSDSTGGSSVVRLIVFQPERYRFIVGLRKVLREQIAGVQTVQTLDLKKDRVELAVTLDSTPAFTAFQKNLEGTQVEGRLLQVSKVSDQEFEIRF